MKAILMAAAVALAFSGAALAADKSGMDKGGGSANPGEKGSPTTPKQPNETQPGSMDKDKGKGKGMKGEKGAGPMKSDTMSGGTGMSGGSGMSSGASNPGNPAEKGSRTPGQPSETQPGSGSVKK